MNERGNSSTLWLQATEMVKVDDLKYLGSTVQSNEDCRSECRKRVQAGWRKVAGVICNRRVPVEMKGKLDRIAVRPAMLYMAWRQSHQQENRSWSLK